MQSDSCTSWTDSAERDKDPLLFGEGEDASLKHLTINQDEMPFLKFARVLGLLVICSGIAKAQTFKGFITQENYTAMVRMALMVF